MICPLLRNQGYLHLRERSLMVVTEAVIFGRDSLQILSPSLPLLTLELMEERMLHSTWCSAPLLHSSLHTSRLHCEQNCRAEERRRKQFTHWGAVLWVKVHNEKDEIPNKINYYLVYHPINCKIILSSLISGLIFFEV